MTKPKGKSEMVTISRLVIERALNRSKILLRENRLLNERLIEQVKTIDRLERAYMIAMQGNTELQKLEAK